MKHLFAVSAAAAVMALTASAAGATTVVGATSITITSAYTGSDSYVQVSELVADNFSNVDVALATNGGSAVGSSDWPSSSPAYAIDGVAPDAFNHIFHSAGSGSNEFLTVSFAASNLSSLSVYGRTDCCAYRDLYNYSIFAGTQLLASGQLNATGEGHVGTVRFAAAAPGVPEPMTWALMLVGFGGAGAALRRRRSALAATA